MSAPDPRRPDTPPRTVQRVNVDFPLALLRAIDAECTRLGIARQAFIKLRMADALDMRQALDRDEA